MAERFYKIFDNVLSDDSLSYPEMILYGVIVRLSRNDEGKCYASNQALSEIMRCSKSSVSKWLDTLTKQGYITRSLHYMDGTKHIDRRYITPVTISSAELQGDIPSDGKGVYRDSDIGYSAELQEDTPPNYKDSKINRVREDSKITEKDKLVREQNLYSVISEFDFSDELSKALTEWTDYKLGRKEIQKIEWFKNQLAAIRKSLERHSETDIITLIYECMANGWKTIPLDRLSKPAPRSSNFFLNLAAKEQDEI